MERVVYTRYAVIVFIIVATQYEELSTTLAKLIVAT